MVEGSFNYMILFYNAIIFGRFNVQLTIDLVFFFI